MFCCFDEILRDLGFQNVEIQSCPCIPGFFPSPKTQRQKSRHSIQPSWVWKPPEVGPPVLHSGGIRTPPRSAARKDGSMEFFSAEKGVFFFVEAKTENDGVIFCISG